MGDFYELFFDDAKIAAKELGLTLTSRGHGTSGDVPLAGFPYHALDGYLTRMIKSGYKVAICEQVEDPKKAKTIVKREVTDIVTAGTILSGNLLDSKQNNFLSAVYFEGAQCGLAKVDLSTGEFSVIEFPQNEAEDYLLNVNPAEVLVSSDQADFLKKMVRKLENFVVSKRDEWLFERSFAYETIIRHFNTTSLKGFGCEDLRPGLSAAGVILHYLQENKKAELGHIRQLRREYPEQHMVLDPATLRNLEVLSTLMGDQKEGSLISILDRTVTPMGGRLMRRWIQYPLRAVREINGRLDAVEELVEDKSVRSKLIASKKSVGDLERLNSKICARRCNARDFIGLRNSLRNIPELLEYLGNLECDLIQKLKSDLRAMDSQVELIERAITEDPPLSISDGGMIREKYDGRLDEYRELAYSGKKWIAGHQALEREKTGIPSLKVGYNKVFGYYIEVTKSHLSKIPASYIRKQTLVNAERYITPELKEYEEKILHAEEKMAELEYELFEEIRIKIVAESSTIQKNAQLIAQLDVLCSLAEVAESENYAKPFVDDQHRIEIEDGRHPVVEEMLPVGQEFIPNDTYIDNEDHQILVITGPNMAGKSTFIRQVGLITLMAQMGSFVPAKAAKIGVVDRIFTRVGASDNLAGGESTFMVEMTEMANILNNASNGSLILLDEIGRGTSTFDGLSIAWSVAEYLHDNPKISAKTLFATHYHELTELELILKRVKNYNVAIKEWGDQIIFLRKIVPGGCDHSYGIQVARLAGLPANVIDRAREVLANLEADELTPSKTPRLARHKRSANNNGRTQLDLFRQEKPEIFDELSNLNINDLTPLQALNKLEKLKKMLNDGEKQ
jgi:DNA mismatch repair protein MutS